MSVRNKYQPLRCDNKRTVKNIKNSTHIRVVIIYACFMIRNVLLIIELNVISDSHIEHKIFTFTQTHTHTPFYDLIIAFM